MDMLKSFKISLGNQFNYLVNFLFVSFLFVSFVHGSHPIPPSKTTEDALENVIQLNQELGHYGGSISELILKGSYIQDVLYSYLLQAEDVGEYHRGMQLIDNHMKSYNSLCIYMSNVFNFYRGTQDRAKPQCVDVYFNGQKTTGFLNTFKLDGPLTDQEREFYFYQEYNKYIQDCLAKPFILDSLSIETLEPDTLYNYVLLPDGTIRAALERPGEREYHVRDEMVVEAFNYPNHTILAGHPEQVVITAGAFIMHKEGSKRLFFVSCKSGHFQPYYSSLPCMRIQLANFGLDPYTIICINDVDLSQSVLKTYNGAKIPVFISTHDNQRLFDIAAKRWDKTYDTIDREILIALAEGDFSVINLELISTLKKQRAESTYMRSAFRLFSNEHAAPGVFNEFVKQYGKLKDLIKHFSWKELNYDKVKAHSANLIHLMNLYDKEKVSYEFDFSDTNSFYKFLTGNIAQMIELMERESLSKEEFHNLKKLSRELCALFLYLSEDAILKGRGFFIYRTAADAFFQINDLMAKSDYIYAVKVNDEVRVKVPRKIVNQLIRNINHLGIAPPSFPIELDADEMASMINNAKDVYQTSYFSSKLLRESLENDVDASTFDYEKNLAHFEWLLRDAEIARNALIFLDASHQPTENYQRLIAKTKQFIKLLKSQDFNGIVNEADEMHGLCYHAVDLKNWVHTDQKSLSLTLESHLYYLGFIQEGALLSKEVAEEVVAKVQALRDFINLIRRNGLKKKMNVSQVQQPMICFEALEEHADVILKGLKEGHQPVLVTPAMKLSAESILSRVDTRQ
jgi:hypothetical protein